MTSKYRIQNTANGSIVEMYVGGDKWVALAFFASSHDINHYQMAKNWIAYENYLDALENV